MSNPERKMYTEWLILRSNYGIEFLNRQSDEEIKRLYMRNLQTEVTEQ